MSETENSPHTPEFANQAPPPLPVKLGMLTFLWKLFLHPREAILNARIHRTWFRCLFIVLTAALLASVIHTWQRLPDINRQFQTVQDLLAANVDSLRLNPQTRELSWELKGRQNPVINTASNGFKLQADDAPLKLNKRELEESDEQAGLYLAKNALVCWKRMAPGSNHLYFFNLHEHKLVEDVFRQHGQPEGNAFVIDQTVIQQILGIARPVIMLLDMMQTLFEHLYIVGSCIFIFMLMSLVFRSLDRAPFTGMLASNIACLIPPFLLTLMLASTSIVKVNTGNISTCFTIFFVVYLIIILLDRSISIKIIKLGKDTPPGDDA